MKSKNSNSITQINKNSKYSVTNSQSNLEKKFESTIKWLIKFSQLFGAAPMNLTYRTIDTTTPSSIIGSLVISAIHLIWCAFIFISMLTAIYFQREQFDSSNVPKISQILYNLEYLSNVINCLIILIGCNYQKKLFNQYFNKFIEIDMQLIHCGASESFGQLKQFLFKCTIAIGCILCAIVINDFIYNEYIFLNFLRSQTVYIIPNIMELLSLLQYFVLLYALWQRYHQITSILTNLTTSNRIENHVNVLSLNTFINEGNYQQQQQLKTPNLTQFGSTLTLLRKLHYELNVLTSNICNSFGILTFSVITTSFCVVTLQLYALYQFIIGGNDIQINVALIVYTILWLILQSGKVYFIVLLNSNVATEVRIFFKYYFLLHTVVISLLFYHLLELQK